MTVDVWSVVESIPEVASDAEFAECWRPIGQLLEERGASGELAMLEVMRDAGALQSGSVHPAWGGGWQWDMSGAAAKSVLTSAIVYGLLVAAGVPALLPVVVPAVIPLLFEIKKVRLTRSEQNVIKIIGARKNALTRRGTTKDLYRSLPEDVRRTLTRREFEEFVDAAIAAGVAKEDGDVVEVLKNGDSVFHLRIT